jgi:hypothetical protein
MMALIPNRYKRRSAFAPFYTHTQRDRFSSSAIAVFSLPQLCFSMSLISSFSDRSFKRKIPSAVFPSFSIPRSFVKKNRCLAENKITQQLIFRVQRQIHARNRQTKKMDPGFFLTAWSTSPKKKKRKQTGVVWLDEISPSPHIVLFFACCQINANSTAPLSVA